MTVTKSTLGWRYLGIGVIACFVMAAVAAINTQDVLFAVALAAAAFTFYVGIFEFTSIVRATTRTPVILIGGAGLILCFVVLMAVGNAVTSGHFNLLPDRASWWALPIGVAIWTAHEVWRRKRPISK